MKSFEQLGNGNRPLLNLFQEYALLRQLPVLSPYLDIESKPRSWFAGMKKLAWLDWLAQIDQRKFGATDTGNVIVKIIAKLFK